MAKKSVRKELEIKPRSIGRKIKIVAAIGESVLAIPFLGFIIAVGFKWIPLIVMLVLHIVSIVISKKEKKNMVPNALGIIANTVGIIPFVGLVLHITTAIFLWLDLAGIKIQ